MPGKATTPYYVLGKRTILAADGMADRTSGSYVNSYGYTSRRNDEESRLMYFGARMLEPTTGEFASQDPLEYVDGMSLYRGYFAQNGVDPIGLWTIIRSGKARAKAIPEGTSDTLRDLGFAVGLRPREIAEWLTIENDNGMPRPALDDPLGWTYCGDLPDFFVPNTIYSVWGGDGGRAGRAWSGHNGVNDKGFKIESLFLDDVLNRWNHSETKRSFQGKLLGTVSKLSSGKELHGFQFTGHGTPTSIQGARYFGDGWYWSKKAVSVKYSSITSRLNYKLSVVVLAACFSDFMGNEKATDCKKGWKKDGLGVEGLSNVIPLNGGGRDLWSQMPAPAKFVGDQGLWIPTPDASDPWWYD